MPQKYFDMKPKNTTVAGLSMISIKVFSVCTHLDAYLQLLSLPPRPGELNTKEMDNNTASQCLFLFVSFMAFMHQTERRTKHTNWPLKTRFDDCCKIFLFCYRYI